MSLSTPSLDIFMSTIFILYSFEFQKILFSVELSWSRHIQYISKKISKGVGIIKKIRPFLNRSTLVNLYYAFIYPFLSYCIHVWGSTHAVHLTKLKVLQKLVVRIIAGVPFRAHTSPLFKTLKLLKFDYIFILNIGIFMYKYNHKLLPSIFNSFFKRNSEFHEYETSKRNMLIIPFCRTNRIKRTIRYQGVIIWNKILSLNINVTLSIDSYKFYMKKALLQGNLVL